MGQLIDFQQHKNRREAKKTELVMPKREGYCALCNAPTLISYTSVGTPMHKFDPDNDEAYKKMRMLLVIIVQYFKGLEEGISDEDLIEAFGDGMREFLREMNDGRT